MRTKGKNVFVNFLALLGVRYTESFAHQTYFVIYMQSDKRKPAAGLFRMRRLLYFTRAVGFPTRRQHNARVG